MPLWPNGNGSYRPMPEAPATGSESAHIDVLRADLALIFERIEKRLDIIQDQLSALMDQKES